MSGDGAHSGLRILTSPLGKTLHKRKNPRAEKHDSRENSGGAFELRFSTEKGNHWHVSAATRTPKPAQNIGKTVWPAFLGIVKVNIGAVEERD